MKDMPAVRSSQKRSPVYRMIKSCLILLFWLCVWEAGAYFLNQPLFLPKVTTVLQTLFRLIVTKNALGTAVLSLLRILEGYLFGVLLGILLAIVCSFVPLLQDLFTPVLTVIRSTPVASFIMLLWLILGNKNLPVAIALLMVLPVVYANLYAGIAEIPKDLSEVCLVYQFSPWKRFTFLYYPSVMPYLSPALVGALGLAWKAGVAAEVLAHTPLSIGNEIYLSKAYLEIEELYAWTLLVVLMSLLLEKIMRQLLKKWQKGDRSLA